MISVDDHVTNLSRRYGDFTREITGDSQLWVRLFDQIPLTEFIYFGMAGPVFRVYVL